MDEETTWRLVSSARHPDEDSVVATVLMDDGVHVFVGQQLEDGTRTWTPDSAAGHAMAVVFETESDAATDEERKLAHAADDCMAGLTQLPWPDITGATPIAREASISLVSHGGGHVSIAVGGALKALEWDIGDSDRKTMELKVADASLVFVALAQEAFSGLTLNGLGAWLTERDIPHLWEADYYE